MIIYAKIELKTDVKLCANQDEFVETNFLFLRHEKTQKLGSLL